MSQPADITSTLTDYNKLKAEILHSFTNPPCHPEYRLAYRENQLLSLLRISESLSNLSGTEPLSDHQEIATLKQQCLKLENLHSVSEENLKKSRSEVKFLKSEIQRLEKNKGDNNLFTVEVYQSEIEDLKKDYSEKLTELHNQISSLQSTNLQRNFVDLRNKYIKVKEQLISLRGKVSEFEEVMIVNNEQKKVTEEKYLELVKTHKKMFGYIEKLEQKVKKFQINKKKSGFSASSKDDSRSLLSI